MWVRILIGIGALALFFAYAWLPLQTSGIWSSPDETAVAFTVRNLPAFGDFWSPATPYATSEIGWLVHPRSFEVVAGRLVPAMWLGLPWILSLVHRMTGASIEWVELCIPLLAVCAVFAWQRLVAVWFEDARVGWVAALALAVHPGWWYFTARGLHPNVAFAAFGILALWSWYVMRSAAQTRRPGRLWEPQAWALFSGLCLGCMIFVRTNELVWIAPLVVVLAWYERAQWKQLLWGLGGVLFIGLMALHVQATIFGDAFANPYHLPSGPVLEQAVSDAVSPTAPSSLTSLLFPFGWHERSMLRNFYNYQIAFFPLWSALTVFGVLLLLLQWTSVPETVRKRLLRVGVIVLPVCAYLVALYGSWNFNDNPDPHAVTIGTSYIRYWLPLTLVATPFIGWFVRHMAPLSRPLWYRRGAPALFAVALVASGGVQTFLAQDEGLLATRDHLRQFLAEREALLAHTQPQDLVIVDRDDKILFPYRSVLLPLRSQTTYDLLGHLQAAALEQGGALYYWGVTLPPEDVNFFQEVRLDPFGLTFEPVLEMHGQTLYSIYER